MPARAINHAGKHRASLLSIQDFVRDTSNATTVCSVSDVIVIQRAFVEPVISRIKHWQAKGIIVVGDFDDAFDLMPKSNPGYKYWNQGKVLRKGQDGQSVWVKVKPHPLDQFKRGLGFLDLITVSSDMLVKDWNKYNASIRCIPNYIQLDRYMNIRTKSHEGIVIGWGGSATHLESFQNSKILPSLQKICRQYQNVKLMICGNDPKILEKIPVPSRQLVHQPFVDVEQWPGVLSNFDIGLAPLHGPYDERRSWIKVLEYLVMSIPWVATNAAPYAMFKNYGFLVDNNEDEWVTALKKLIENIGQYKKKAALEPYMFGALQDVSKNVKVITDIYEQYLVSSLTRKHSV